MNTHRVSPVEILTDGPIEKVRELIWYGLLDAGVRECVIDVERNVVVGSTGANLSTYGQAITARLESQTDGTLITVRSEAQVQGTIDFGKSKRQAKGMADAIENSLRQGPREAPAVELTPATPLAPIADPSGITTPVGSGPMYGTAMPPKRGTAILVYGLLGVSCCQIAGPLAWYYGGKALKEYGATDPGDKTMVRIGWVLGIIGTLILLLRIGLYITVIGGN